MNKILKLHNIPITEHSEYFNFASDFVAFALIQQSFNSLENIFYNISTSKSNIFGMFIFVSNVPLIGFQPISETFKRIKFAHVALTLRNNLLVPNVQSTRAPSTRQTQFILSSGIYKPEIA